MGELYNPFPKLPKNIRQIGERDQSVRLYMEDYVNTYLKRLYPKGGQDLRVGLLLGTSEEHEGTPYLFVDGAMEMEDVTEEREQVVFTEAAWKKAYQTMEQMFPKRVILGWFLCGAEGTELSPLNYWKQHGQYFAGQYQLMYLSGGPEGEESVYVTAEDGFYKLRGHSIYYERNQMMQDYMIHRKDVRRVESGAGDTVIRDFRQRMEENKTQVASRRGAIRVLGSMCSLLAILVLAGGVAMMDNYEKMKEMEAVIASALPDKSQPKYEIVDGDIQEGESFGLEDDQLFVEEAKGQVEQYRESMSQSLSDLVGQETGQAAGDGQASGQRDDADSADTAETATDSAETSAYTGGNATAGGSFSQSFGTQSSQVSVSAENLKEYKVQDGETLYGICLKFYGTGSRMAEICQLNGLDDEDKIISGQNLLLP